MKNSRTCLGLSSMETGYMQQKKQDTAGIYQEQEITT